MLSGTELVILSNNSALAKGETALQACVGQGFPSVEINWLYNGQILMNSSLASISEQDVTQGDEVFKQSFLQICNLTLIDAGGYTCIVSNGEISAASSTQLTVTGTLTIPVLAIYTNHEHIFS